MRKIGDTFTHDRPTNTGYFAPCHNSGRDGNSPQLNGNKAALRTM